MSKSRLKRFVGRFLYFFASKMPESTTKPNFGAKDYVRSVES